MSDRVREQVELEKDKKGNRASQVVEKVEEHTGNPILSLQQKVGNRAVQGLLKLKRQEIKDIGILREIAAQGIACPFSRIPRKHEMERAFGADFSNVKAHIGSKVQKNNKESWRKSLYCWPRHRFSFIIPRLQNSRTRADPNTTAGHFSQYNFARGYFRCGSHGIGGTECRQRSYTRRAGASNFHASIT